ncbi:Alpha/Beta hydrolase protein [Gloeopeniophorella convolvens]|nr:Alpha/Beta hydrolase protein [Gloeopeniophorella convolvens]
MADLEAYRGDEFPRLTLRQGLCSGDWSFRENKGRSWRRASKIALTRHVFSERWQWDVKTLKSFIGATTLQTYNAWTHKNKLEPLTDALPEGGRLHWIGPRKEDRVILFFHGGGFVIPASDDQLNALGSLQKEYKGAVGVALLNYSLAPEWSFPRQLRQAVAAVQYLLDKGTDPPTSSSPATPSAGFLHPHATLPDPRLARPLAGAVLISPWAQYGTDSPAHKRNAAKDFVPPSMYRFLGDQLRPGITPELRNYLEPGVAPAEWWTGLDRVFGRVLVTAGEHEGPIDHIQELSTTISAHVKDTTVFVLPGGVHEDLIVGFGVGEGQDGDDYKLAVSWISETLKLSPSAA